MPKRWKAPPSGSELALAVAELQRQGFRLVWADAEKAYLRVPFSQRGLGGLAKDGVAGLAYLLAGVLSLGLLPIEPPTSGGVKLYLQPDGSVQQVNT